MRSGRWGVPLGGGRRRADVRAPGRAGRAGVVPPRRPRRRDRRRPLLRPAAPPASPRSSRRGRSRSARSGCPRSSSSIYALAWSAAWLWQFLSPGQPITDFPDIDVAWDEIVAALDKAGIGIADTPIFLVFGEFPAGFEPLFRALPQRADRGGRQRAGQPAPGVRQPRRHLPRRPRREPAGDAGLGRRRRDERRRRGGSISQSVGVGAVHRHRAVGRHQHRRQRRSAASGVAAGRSRRFSAIIRRARDENRPLSEDEKKRVRELSGGGGGAPRREAGRGIAGAAASVLQNARLVARGRRPARPRVRARSPRRGGRSARSTARSSRCPAVVVRAGRGGPAVGAGRPAKTWPSPRPRCKLRFPVYALVGGVEDLPGGQRSSSGSPPTRAAQRLGKGFPLNPDLQPDRPATAVEKAAGWVFGSLLPYWAFG